MHGQAHRHSHAGRRAALVRMFVFAICPAAAPVWECLVSGPPPPSDSGHPVEYQCKRQRKTKPLIDPSRVHTSHIVCDVATSRDVPDPKLYAIAG